MLLRLLFFIFIITFGTTGRALDYSLSGFLSLGAGLINEEGYNIGDIYDKISFDNDTILGGQLITRFNPQYSGTLQVIARGHSLDDSNNYQPSIDWVYLTYDLTPEIRIRAGRMATPYYLASEYIEIGITYPWIRPPLEVYDPYAAPFKSFNGIDVVLKTNWKDWFIMTQFLLGQEENSTDIYSTNIHRLTGLNINFSNEYFSFRIAHFRSDVSLNIYFIEEETAPLRAIPNNPTIDKLVEIMESQHIPHHYSSVGLTWDNDNWFVYSEYNLTGSGIGYSTDGEGFYTTVGYRIGKITPYITKAGFRAILGSKLKDFILKDMSELAFIGDPILESIKDNARYQRSITVGLRYDISNSISAKIEAQRNTPKNGSLGIFLSKDSSITFAPEIDVYSIVLDLVF